MCCTVLYCAVLCYQQRFAKAGGVGRHCSMDRRMFVKLLRRVGLVDVELFVAHDAESVFELVRRWLRGWVDT